MNKHFFSGDILLPKGNFEKWAVIACDQFTSQESYWNEVVEFVKDANSALHITLPEIYLEDNTENRIEKINSNMKEYLENGVFEEYKDAMIYTSRIQSDGKLRKGIVGLVNLEDYDYKPGSKALIRATEQTVAERIPPRVQIRKDAPLELPHILLLVDDPKGLMFEPVAKEIDNFKMLYDFDLMLGAGHISGYLMNDKAKAAVDLAVNSLLQGQEDKMLFAVGDGNHSLATAKTCAKEDNLASKYALVEVVNIHDEAIEFEPIYRVLFGCEPQKVLKDMSEHFELAQDGNSHKFEIVFEGKSEELCVKPTSKLPVGTLQVWLDEYLKEHSEISIDYVHGTDSVRQLCEKSGTLGFLFEGMKKDELFEAVRIDGALPRKTFSMGHAKDKKFYIESRKIK